ncbi:MAG: glycine cleavage system protein H, partial [Ktedonobacteraceae bacterium]|nr:glycine cleavage system protein H [Ktedonobacteraceae bacterium]
IVKVNEDLQDQPEWINDSPYGDGWMLVVKLSNPAELDKLINAEQYRQHLQGQ